MYRDMRMKKLFCLIGYTASGKDTILKQVLNNRSDLLPVISTTTRPKRVDETEGVEYYFLSDVDFFNKSTDFVEKRVYYTKVKENGIEKDAVWRYGIERAELEKGDYLISIVDAEGFKELKKYVGNNRIVPIYIEADEESLKERALKRGDLEVEVDRRIKDDKDKFMEFRVKVVFDTVKNKNGHLDEAVKEVERIIEKHIREVEEAECISKRKK